MWESRVEVDAREFIEALYELFDHRDQSLELCGVNRSRVRLLVYAHELRRLLAAFRFDALVGPPAHRRLFFRRVVLPPTAAHRAAGQPALNHLARPATWHDRLGEPAGPIQPLDRPRRLIEQVGEIGFIENHCGGSGLSSVVITTAIRKHGATNRCHAKKYRAGKGGGRGGYARLARAMVPSVFSRDFALRRRSSARRQARRPHFSRAADFTSIQWPQTQQGRKW